MSSLFLCKVNPQESSQELMFQDYSLSNALALHYDLDLLYIQKLVSQLGDYGSVAEQLFIQSEKGSQKFQEKSLNLSEVRERIKDLFKIQGKGSREQKSILLSKLLGECNKKLEQKFLLRIINGSLRIGVSDQSYLNALENVLAKKKNLDKNFIAEVIQELESEVLGFNSGLQNEIIQFGIPCPVQLAKSIDKLEEIKKFVEKDKEKFILADIKYDGERSQVHFSKEKGVYLFSRTFEKQNKNYENLVKQIEKELGDKNIKEAVLDCEIVAFDWQSNKIESFQSLQNKKLNQQEDLQKLIQKIFVFDIIQLDGKNLAKKNLCERKKILSEIFKTENQSDLFCEAQGKIFNSDQNDFIPSIKNFLQETIQKGFEGLMLKKIYTEKSFYLSNNRSNWIKLKRGLLEENFQESLDLVPIAAYYGKGKNKNLISSFLMAAYDPLTDSFEAVTKLGTGFSQELLQQQTEKCLENAWLPKDSRFKVSKTFNPDIWLKPNQVWEVKCDSFSVSKIYKIGRETIAKEGGISLRFPRFITIRNDRNYSNSTSKSQILEMYKQQEQNQVFK